MAWPCASKPITYTRSRSRAREKESRLAMRGRCSPRWCLRGTGGCVEGRGGGEEEEELAKGGKEKRARVGEVERRSGDGSVAATACSVSLPRRSGRPVTPSLT